MKSFSLFSLSFLSVAAVGAASGAQVVFDDIPAPAPVAEQPAAEAPLPSEHQVNVIYFLGNDNEPVPGYETRLSDILLHLQGFYGSEMQRNGYGNRSFGLRLTPEGRAAILVLRGKLPSAEYGYDNGGAWKCLEEINEHFKAHPEDCRSQHSFIIMPTFYNAEYNDDTPGGVPFFGLGTNCFALDYAHFDLRYLGEDSDRGRLLTKWYGGFAHELGHGLNLPHNNGSATENAAHGTALLNCGNYTFGLKPTYLTPASCRLLDRSETFAPQGSTTTYYATHEAPAVEDVAYTFDGAALHLSLTTPADWLVNAYVQDPPYYVNQDYDAVAFPLAPTGAPADGKQTHSVTIPLSELTSLSHTAKAEQALDLLLLAPDGSRFRTRLPLDWATIKPNQEIKPDKLEFSEGY